MMDLFYKLVICIESIESKEINNNGNHILIGKILECPNISVYNEELYGTKWIKIRIYI